jgi:tripartite-type tricarboxylate transporter receptor subunit TctC
VKKLQLAIMLALWSLAAANAVEYPTHPVRFIVPFAAGGPTDALARIIAERMGRSLGRSIVIENITGAGGSIGVERVVHAAADGYTVNFGNWSTQALNGAIYALAYDPSRDLEPVALLPSSPQIIVARKDIKANSLAELISLIKSNKVTLGTAGVGSAGHVSALLFEKQTGTQLTLVHYRGGGPAMTDLIGGHIDLMVDQATTSLPQIREGTVKAFAVTSPSRLTSDPAIPTTGEAGLPDFQVAVWHGLWVPKGTPSTVINALAAAARETLSDPAIIDRLTALGLTLPAPDQVSAAGLAKVQRDEIDKWWPILKAANVKAE